MTNLKIFLFLSLVYGGYLFYLTTKKNEQHNSQINTQSKNHDQFKRVKIKKTPFEERVVRDQKKIDDEADQVVEKIQSKTKRLEIFENQEDDFITMTKDGDLVINEVFIDGPNVLFHGDILISDLDEFNDNQLDEKPIVLPKPKPWPDGIVPYEIASDLVDPQRVQMAIDYMNKNTVIKFVKRENQKGYVYFKNGLNNCYSYLGYLGKKQDISLSKGCGVGQILHEIMHALGFFHEQNRADRDDYLDINWKNIDEKYHINFKKISFKAMLEDQTKFDFNSILLYPPYAFALIYDEYTMIKRDGEIYYGNTTGKLSSTDIERINIVYKKKQN